VRCHEGRQPMAQRRCEIPLFRAALGRTELGLCNSTCFQPLRLERLCFEKRDFFSIESEIRECHVSCFDCPSATGLGVEADPFHGTRR
jgi:hypothetical protein